MKSFDGVKGGGDPSNPYLFAQNVLTDANVVHSDAGLVTFPLGEGKIAIWRMAPNDSLLSKNHTLVELVGYFRDFLCEKSYDDEAGRKDCRESLPPMSAEKFYGVGVNDLMNYPEGNRPGAVEAVDAMLDKVFGEQSPKLKFNMMLANGKNRTKGLPFFSRPSWMTSEMATRNFGGDSLLLLCTAATYGKDMFRADKFHEEYAAVPLTAIRSSIIDRVAASALQDAKADRNVGAHITRFAGGQIACRPKENDDYRVGAIPGLKCMTNVPIDQPAAVVRRGPADDRDQRLIQTGFALWGVECRFGGDNDWVDIGDWKGKSGESFSKFMKAIARDPAVTASPLGQKFLDHTRSLIDPGDDDREYYERMARSCDDLIRTRTAAGNPHPGSHTTKPEAVHAEDKGTVLPVPGRRRTK